MSDKRRDVPKTTLLTTFRIPPKEHVLSDEKEDDGSFSRETEIKNCQTISQNYAQRNLSRINHRKLERPILKDKVRGSNTAKVSKE